MVPAFGLKGLKPQGHFFQGLVPADLLPAAFASPPHPFQGGQNPVGVVEMIDACNSSCAEPSPAIGVKGVSPYSFDLSVFEVSQDPAACGAHHAGTRDRLP